MQFFLVLAKMLNMFEGSDGQYTTRNTSLLPFYLKKQIKIYVVEKQCQK